VLESLLLLLSPQGNFKPTKLPQPSFSTPPGNTMTEPSRNPLASNSLLPSQSTNQRPPSSPLTELSSIGRQLSPTQSCSLQSDLADCLLSPVLLRIAELQDCIDNDLPIPSRKKSTSSSSTAASFSAAPSRSRTSHPTSTTASDNIPPPKDLSPPARPVSSLKRSRKQESLVQLQLPSQSPQPNIFDDIIPNLPQPSPSHADTTDEFDRYDDEDAEPRRPTKKRSLPPSAAALPSTRAKAPNSTTSKSTVASSKRSKKAAPSSPAPLLAPDSWDELPKPRPVRVSGTAANRILARRASDSSDDEDDLGGYDVSQDGEWVPEVVERAGGRRTGAGKRR
jgi:hypothetical protein